MFSELAPRARRAWLFSRAYVSLVRAERKVDRNGFEAACAAMVRPWRASSQRHSPDAPLLAAVDKAIDSAARWYWRRLNCLPRAIAAYDLLRSIGAQPLLHLGFRTKPFSGHAWTTVSHRIVGDSRNGAGRGDYVVLETIPASDEDRRTASRAPRDDNGGSRDNQNVDPLGFGPTTHVRVADHIRFVESNGEVIVMDKRSNSVCGIDGPWGTALLAFARRETLGSVIDHVHSLYDTDREIVEADIAALIADLCQRGWVTLEASSG